MPSRLRMPSFGSSDDSTIHFQARQIDLILILNGDQAMARLVRNQIRAQIRADVKSVSRWHRSVDHALAEQDVRVEIGWDRYAKTRECIQQALVLMALVMEHDDPAIARRYLRSKAYFAVRRQRRGEKPLRPLWARLFSIWIGEKS